MQTLVEIDELVNFGVGELEMTDEPIHRTESRIF